jgi:hypothetical protein
VGATGVKWVEDRVVSQLPAVHRTGPNNKKFANCPTVSFSRAVSKQHRAGGTVYRILMRWSCTVNELMCSWLCVLFLFRRLCVLLLIPPSRILDSWSLFSAWCQATHRANEHLMLTTSKCNPAVSLAWALVPKQWQKQRAPDDSAPGEVS